MDTLVVRLREAGRAASLAGANEIKDVARAKLSELHHSPFTYSPAPPGAPPAAVSEDLAASMDAQMMTEDQAWVGPTGLPYARIQELGGEMHGHPLMIYHKLGPYGLMRITSEFVALPPRPYLRPSTEDVVDSGRLTEIYIEHWSAAIEEVAG